MYKKKIITLFLLIFLIGFAVADELTLRHDHPNEYTVVKGDTLWDISARFFQDPWHWPSIWHANPEIANPHLIYPGDLISLVYIDGKPRITVTKRSRDVKLTPQGRIEPIHKAIPTIPLDAILPFLTKPQIVGKDTLDNAPYMVQSDEEHLIAATGNRIYVRGVADSSVKNYSVVHSGKTYKDPDTDEVLGYEAIYVGDAVLLDHGDPSTFKLGSTKREVLIGDRLLASGEDSYNAHFLPRVPDVQIEGRILAVMGGVNQIGTHQVVVINRGEREGLEPGHVLAVYQLGKTVRDTVSSDSSDTVKLPDVRAGTMMVFRTFDRLSYALIMRANRNLQVLDSVRTQ